MRVRSNRYPESSKAIAILDPDRYEEENLARMEQIAHHLWADLMLLSPQILDQNVLLVKNLTVFFGHLIYCKPGEERFLTEALMQRAGLIGSGEEIVLG